MSTALATLAGKLAERVGMDSVDPQELITTLRQTAFKGDASDAQFIALLIVANQYGLNPWTKEIYAFPDKQNGIVPVVGVDGWSRIINENQQFVVVFRTVCVMRGGDKRKPGTVAGILTQVGKDMIVVA
jgi:phage recombination protein Bet